MDCMVKGVRYTLENCGVPVAKDYERYACFYFYLSPADYHCFHSPISGVIDDIVDFTNTSRLYSGSVKMDCLDASPSVLIHNRRYVVIIKHANGFKLAMVVIGGFLVGTKS
jgi:phosphatidylserine decarboxylase